MKDLAPVPTDQIEASISRLPSQKRSSRVRRDASEGNFEKGNGTLASGSENLIDRASFSNVVNRGTAVGRKLQRLTEKR